MYPEQSIAEKLAASLTAETTELLPYLPYLLQDLWTLGTGPDVVIDLVQQYVPNPQQAHFLDLGCGKGAVTVALANALKMRVTGIDIIPDFIQFAEGKAGEHGVSSLCRFINGDINSAVETERGYDGVILGAVGDVLGTPEETVNKLKNTVKEQGLIIIDDAFANTLAADIKYQKHLYLTRSEWINVFEKCGVILLESPTFSEDDYSESNESELRLITMRANELSRRYPDKKALFDSYVESQKNECYDLDNSLTGVVWLLKKIA